MPMTRTITVQLRPPRAELSELLAEELVELLSEEPTLTGPAGLSAAFGCQGALAPWLIPAGSAGGCVFGGGPGFMPGGGPPDPPGGIPGPNPPGFMGPPGLGAPPR